MQFSSDIQTQVRQRGIFQREQSEHFLYVKKAILVFLVDSDGC
jgi:hypothetical protein